MAPLVYILAAVTGAAVVLGSGKPAAAAQPQPGGGGGGGGATPPSPSYPGAPSAPSSIITPQPGQAAPYVTPSGTAVFPDSPGDPATDPVGSAASSTGTNADSGSDWYDPSTWFSSSGPIRRHRVGQVQQPPPTYGRPVAHGSEWIWSDAVQAWIPPYPGYSRGAPVPAGLPAHRPLSYN
jgi:hypothetical protein